MMKITVISENVKISKEHIGFLSKYNILLLYILVKVSLDGLLLIY